MKVAVVGAGSWGTALALQASRVGHRVRMWDHAPERAAAMQAARENARYLPGCTFPESLTVSGNLAFVLEEAEVVVEAVPSVGLRAVLPGLREHLPRSAVVVCATKGIEVDSLLTMDEILLEGLRPGQPLATLGGPSFAKEVAQGMPTAVVIACRDSAAAQAAAEALHGGFFRVYDTDDVVGVELGAALKNVVAVACGVSDGAGLGTNARAALITRGLSEISRLAARRGADPLTLMGLAGLGDLVLTCTGDLSRNRRVGLGLGRGKTLDEVLAELGQVAEGVVTARSAWQLAQREGVEMPITEQVYRMLYEEKPVFDVLRDLAGRGRRSERG
jgi:glycerol-3-phosphate dehydrogenase (NAD(P)+)